jgi:glycosyltransferase involved in cell wall biosynthesis
MRYCSIAYTNYEFDYRVRRYAEALVGFNNKIDAFALAGENGENKQKLNGVQLYKIQKREFKEKKQLHYLINILKFFIKGTFIVLMRHLKHRYDIIHVHNVPDFLVLMAFIPRLLGARVILDLHDILPEFYCQKFNKPFDSKLTKVLLIIEKLSVRAADHVIVANDIWREKLIVRNRLNSENCTTILNYPKLEFYEDITYFPNNNTLNLIYPGTMSYLHGLDILIKAIHIVKKKIPNVKLYIYSGSGSIDYRIYIMNLIKSLDLKNNIKICKPVLAENLKNIFQKIDVGVVPKRDGIFSSEAFSTKIFDYMAAGIPIIASKTKIDKYYFDNSMIIFFECNSHQNLAEKIIEIKNNCNLKKSLSEKGKQYIKNNNWDIKKNLFLNIVKKLTFKEIRETEK